MGLGLYIGAEIRRRGLLKRKPTITDTLEGLRKEILEQVGDPLHARLVGCALNEGKLEAVLHPAEEAVEFCVNGRRDIDCIGENLVGWPRVPCLSRRAA